jgi:hypothetical protein
MFLHSLPSLAQRKAPFPVKVVGYVSEADWVSSHIKTLMMEKKSVSETLVYLNHLKQLSS